MTRIRGAGTHRLVSTLTFAVMAVSGQAATALAQVAKRVSVRAKPDTSLDSSRTAESKPVTLISLRRIDSLIKVQEDLPIGSPEYARVQDQIETTIRAALPAGSSFARSGGSVSIIVSPEEREMRQAPLRAQMIHIDVTPRGWLGIDADGLHEEWDDADGSYVRYFEYPTVLGVDPGSPAAKGGVKFGDMLVAYNGVDLRRGPINLTRLLEPGHLLAVRLRRDGEIKEYSIAVEKAPPEVQAERRVATVTRMLMPMRAAVADADRRDVEVQATAGGFGGRGTAAFAGAARAPVAMTLGVPAGYFGARMTDLDAEALAVVSQQKVSNGVLVTMVPPGSPAARMGLRSGDIIVRILDTPVLSMAQLRRELAARPNDQPTQFSVLRDGKIEKLTYEPR